MSVYGDELAAHHRMVRSCLKWIFAVTMLLVGVFSCVYSSSMHSKTKEHFYDQASLNITDAIYLSVLTQTTVGCTQPQPKSTAAKWAVAIQSFTTITLLLLVIIVLLDG